MVRVSPTFTRPEHYARDVVPVLERCLHEPVRLLLAAPPRHGKTETLLHLIAWYIAKNPTHNVAYVSYAAELSEKKSRAVREYVSRAGVELSKSSRAAGAWETAAGGGLDAVGIEGTLTGKGYNLMIIDDPYKGIAVAESVNERGNVDDFYSGTAVARLEPGASLVITHTRWHPEDLIGTLKATTDQGWIYINKPAVNDGDDPTRDVGAPLWPERWPLDALDRRRKEVGEYTWASLYQGHPRPRGGAVFEGCSVYRDFPTDDYGRPLVPKRKSIGVDLAYTAKKWSDYSVAITAHQFGEDIYITNVIRKQIDLPAFLAKIRIEKAAHPSSQIYWFGISGGDNAVLPMFKNFGLYVQTETTKGTGKLERAQAVAAAWNAGHVKVPEDAPWLSEFLSEILTFTGTTADSHDDQVDALASAFQPLCGRVISRGTIKKRILPYT